MARMAYIVSEWVGVYVIDPLGVAAMTTYDRRQFQNQALARQFPGKLHRSIELDNNYYRATLATMDYERLPPTQVYGRFVASLFGSPNAGDPQRQAYFLKTQPLNQASAERSFMSGDDLAIEVPTQADRPSSQRLATFKSDSEQAARATVAWRLLLDHHRCSQRPPQSAKARHMRSFGRRVLQAALNCRANSSESAKNRSAATRRTHTRCKNRIDRIERRRSTARSDR